MDPYGGPQQGDSGSGFRMVELWFTSTLVQMLDSL